MTRNIIFKGRKLSIEGITNLRVSFDISIKDKKEEYFLQIETEYGHYIEKYDSEFTFQTNYKEIKTSIDDFYKRNGNNPVEGISNK
jgi:deoxyadenosine/deoxycytidine kinase